MSRKALFEVSYVDRLLRERDEARAKYSDLLSDTGDHVKEAHAEGYRRGVEDAAKAVKDNQGVYKTKTAEAALEFAWLDVRDLLEKVRLETVYAVADERLARLNTTTNMCGNIENYKI